MAEDEATTNMSPDTTFERYKMDNFESTNAKRVPHEELDYKIYKSSANLVAFQTTEQRLPLWIEAFYHRYFAKHKSNSEIETIWEEQQHQSLPSKCETVTVDINYSKANMLKITIFVSKGRIQVQGRLVKDWGYDEFKHVLDMVNSDGPMKVHYTDTFMNKIIGKEKKNPQPVDTHNNEKATDSPRDKSFSMIKQHLANLEANFVTTNENNINTIAELRQTILKKDNEISLLKEEILSLKSTNASQQQAISDLSMKQMELEEKVEAMSRDQKKYQDKYTAFVKSTQRKQNDLDANTQPSTSETEAEIPSWASMSPKTTTYNIATSNSFDILCDKNTEEEVKKPEEKPAVKSSKSSVKPSDKPYPTSTSSKHDPKPMTENNKQNETKGSDAETIILCDSNGRYIKPNLLCPDSSTYYLQCPTLTQAEKIIEDHHFKNAKCIILHCCTNDLEKAESELNVVTQLEKVIVVLQTKYKDCRIIISGLLPRKYRFHENVAPLNNGIEKLALEKHLCFVTHDNIKAENLKDKKHLNQRGVKIFAKNIKAKYFNTTPRKSRNTKPIPKSTYGQQPTYPFQPKPPMHNPFYHIH